ncbi:MAG: 2Fe-2S iron-sulfur cluster-binding protein [Bacteroidota bacterium]
MIRLKIDNTEVEVSDGQTILDAASKAGIHIPTMCHKDGVEHYSSCMVCMVKDKKRDSYIPSCSALAQDGMEIDASGEDILFLRKKAVELLLSEHRAECEAPCRVVCPAGYNIPAMNRLLIAGETEKAIELAREEIITPEVVCVECPGYCENACRRKKVDQPISIRNIYLFVSQSINKHRAVANAANQNVNVSVEQKKIKNTNPLRKRFSSRIGRLEEAEFKEWLKECTGSGERIREISDFKSAGIEAANCMHCDCRASGDCKLRAVAGEFGIKDPAGKIVYSTIQKKINKNSGLIFENAKCIKCGLCVRVCEDSKDEPALCFIHRGFISIISEPLTTEFDDILMTQTDKCIEVCPTGALSRFK